MPDTRVICIDAEQLAASVAKALRNETTRGSKFVLADGTTAPRLWMIFECPKCGETATLDAFDGPARCYGKVGTDDAHSPTFLVPRAFA